MRAWRNEPLCGEARTLAFLLRSVAKLQTAAGFRIQYRQPLKYLFTLHFYLFPSMWACALKFRHATLIFFAGMAELADALDLGSNTLRCAGSSPVARTKIPATTSVVAGIFVMGKRFRRIAPAVICRVLFAFSFAARKS